MNAAAASSANDLCFLKMERQARARKVKRKKEGKKERKKER